MKKFYLFLPAALSLAMSVTAVADDVGYLVRYSVTDAVTGEVSTDLHENLQFGDVTPSFSGILPAGRAFSGWEPAIADIVDRDADYVAKFDDSAEAVNLKVVTVSTPEDEARGGTFDLYLDGKVVAYGARSFDVYVAPDTQFSVENLIADEGMELALLQDPVVQGVVSEDTEVSVVFTVSDESEESETPTADAPEEETVVSETSDVSEVSDVTDVTQVPEAPVVSDVPEEPVAEEPVTMLQMPEEDPVSIQDDAPAEVFYTVTLDTNGGNTLDPITEKSGLTLELPVPVRSGYAFRGWVDVKAPDGTEPSMTLDLTENVTMKAVWEADIKQVYTIAFDSNGGNAVENISAEDGTVITLPAAERNGYVFLGWANEEGTLVSSVTATGDMTFTAQWQEVPKTTYTIAFDSQGGDAVASITAQAGEEVTLPGAVRDGYVFRGWYTAGGAKVDIYTATENVTFYASWEKEAPKTYIIKFETNGGSQVADIVAEAGEIVVLPESTKSGYVFDGWYTSGGAKVDDLTATEDLTLHANWTAKEELKYNIVFDTQGGDIIANIQAEAGRSVDLPEAAWENHRFLGWYTADGAKVENLTATADTTLYARWMATYKVIFEVNGGNVIDPMVADSGTEVTLPTAVRDGYTFDGWFTGAEGGTKVETLTLNSDVTLYAHWSAIGNCVVTYKDGANGSIFEDVVYSVKVGDKTPAFSDIDPIRDGFTFEGWEPAVAETVTADATYTALWKATELVNDGKSDELAQETKTGDRDMLPIALTGVAALTAAFGGLFYWKKRNSSGEKEE